MNSKKIKKIKKNKKMNSKNGGSNPPNLGLRRSVASPELQIIRTPASRNLISPRSPTTSPATTNPNPNAAQRLNNNNRAPLNFSSLGATRINDHIPRSVRIPSGKMWAAWPEKINSNNSNPNMTPNNINSATKYFINKKKATLKKIENRIKRRKNQDLR